MYEKPQIKIEYRGEKPHYYGKIKKCIEREINYQSVVRNVEREGDEYIVEFNNAATWDLIQIPFLVALRHFSVCIDYDFLSVRKYKFKIVDNNQF